MGNEIFEDFKTVVDIVYKIRQGYLEVMIAQH